MQRCKVERTFHLFDLWANGKKKKKKNFSFSRVWNWQVNRFLFKKEIFEKKKFCNFRETRRKNRGRKLSALIKREAFVIRQHVGKQTNKVAISYQNVCHSLFLRAIIRQLFSFYFFCCFSCVHRTRFARILRHQVSLFTQKKSNMKEKAMPSPHHKHFSFPFSHPRLRHLFLCIHHRSVLESHPLIWLLSYKQSYKFAFYICDKDECGATSSGSLNIFLFCVPQT